MLIGINEDGTVENNGWREISEFTALEKRYGLSGIKALILICDNMSVYGRLKEDVREQKVAKRQIGGSEKESQAFLKSKHYLEAKYLYKSLDYDHLVESKRTFEIKLEEVNSTIKQLPFNEGNASKIAQYTKLQKDTMERINAINADIIQRGAVKKNLNEMMLSGIEIFYERAAKSKTEDALFRNKMRIERRNKAKPQEKE